MRARWFPLVCAVAFAAGFTTLVSLSLAQEAAIGSSPKEALNPKTVEQIANSAVTAELKVLRDAQTQFHTDYQKIQTDLQALKGFEALQQQVKDLADSGARVENLLKQVSETPSSAALLADADIRAHVKVLEDSRDNVLGWIKALALLILGMVGAQAKNIVIAQRVKAVVEKVQKQSDGTQTALIGARATALRHTADTLRSMVKVLQDGKPINRDLLNVVLAESQAAEGAAWEGEEQFRVNREAGTGI